MTHAELVSMLAAAYPTPGWEKPTLRLYAQLLADVDAALLEPVVRDWIVSKADRPTISDLRRACVERQAAAGKQKLPAPDEAWGQVLRAITRIGHTGDPDPMLHPLVAVAVNRLGWRELCMSENQMADRAHFLRLYEGYLERTLRDSAATPGAVPQLPAPTASPQRIGQVIRPALEDKRPETAGLLREMTERLSRGATPTKVKLSEQLGPKEPEAITDECALKRREEQRAAIRRQARELEISA